MNVQVFTRPSCAPCRLTKKALTGVTYTERDVDTDPTAAQEVRDLGYMGVPVVTVELPDGNDHWHGYQPEKNRGTAKGMTHFYFNGAPPDQYEVQCEAGEERVMSVTVRCKSSAPVDTDKGLVHKTTWKVINAEIGTVSKRAGARDDDPNQPSLLDTPTADSDGSTAVDPAEFRDGPSFSAADK